MAETCLLDRSTDGGDTLEEVGAILNLTRERIPAGRGSAWPLQDQERRHGRSELGIPPERAGRGSR